MRGICLYGAGVNRLMASIDSQLSGQHARPVRTDSPVSRRNAVLTGAPTVAAWAIAFAKDDVDAHCSRLENAAVERVDESPRDAGEPLTAERRRNRRNQATASSRTRRSVYRLT